MVDTHCHVLREYYDDIDSIIDEAKKNGIDKIIVNGTDMKSNLEVLELVKKYDCVYGAIGFHPTELDEYEDDCVKWLEEHVNDDKIVAIGEIGLDYHYENTDKLKQKNAFERQIEIASKYSKPVIIHSRDAIQDTYDILKKSNVVGSMHAYSGSLEMAREFIKLGFYIGVGGVSTFKNAKNLIHVIQNIDIEYILLETDSPYLSPEPKRGQVNSPSNIPIIAKKISDLKEISFDEIISKTTNNANCLFDF